MPPRWGWGRAVELMAVLGVVGTTAGWEVQLFRLSNTRRRLHHGGVAYPMRRSRIAPTLKAKQPLELLEVMTDSVANTTVSASEPSLASEARLLAVAGIVGATTGTAVSLLKLSIAATEALSYNEGLRALFQLAGDASNTLVCDTRDYLYSIQRTAGSFDFRVRFSTCAWRRRRWCAARSSHFRLSNGARCGMPSASCCRDSWYGKLARS